MGYPKFADWDGRPAVLLSPGRAFAVLEPGGAWEEVDGADVFMTAGLRTPAEIEATFGPLPPLPSDAAQCCEDPQPARSSVHHERRSAPYPKFGDWEGRPAVLVAPMRAFAVLEPGGAWEEVDGLDVAMTAGLRTPEEIEAAFGPLPPLPVRPETSGDA
jgi:hypothetical protein